MTISVFTPTHNPKWLDECLASLQAQTHSDWEWVVLLNNGARWNTDDSRVRVVISESVNAGVGAYKSEAVQYCQGDILVELDHDDKLMPTALEKVAEAFSENEGVGFVYSDFAQINEDGTPNFTEFDAQYGWSYRDEDGYHVTNSKSHHPHHVAYIWFAPNHLRAFTREAYDLAGGYNDNLQILDDQDLMCRLFSLTKFHHIKENLYLQRVHEGQTQVQADINPRIQTGTVELYNHYLASLLVKWSKDNDLMALDLGAAHNPAQGFTTLDLHDADIVGDVFEVFAGLPDNSVGVIRASDFLEHLDPLRKVEFWNSAHRVLANGGMLISLTPSATGNGAFMDPTHISFYVEQSHWYWTDQNFRRYVPEITARFQASRLVTLFPTVWHEQQNISYVQANLIALKDDSERFGGILSI
jgi:glycosyltransferase involved in cell wall biosynthesis